MRISLNGPNGEWTKHWLITSMYAAVYFILFYFLFLFYFIFLHFRFSYFCLSLFVVILCSHSKDILGLLQRTIEERVIATATTSSDHVRLLVFNQDMAPFGYCLAERFAIRPLLLQFQPLTIFDGLEKQPMWKMVLMDALLVPFRVEYRFLRQFYIILTALKRMLPLSVHHALCDSIYFLFYLLLFIIYFILFILFIAFSQCFFFSLIWKRISFRSMWKLGRSDCRF
jgi:hypothetical protein